MRSAGVATSMRRVLATGGGGIDALRVERCAVPEPKAGEVLVRLRAATLNYRDLLGVRGALPGLTRDPNYVPLSCGCGEVAAVGVGVEGLRAGDRVIPLFDQLWMSGGAENMSSQHLGGMADGVATEYAVFNEAGLVRAPDELNDLEAASLPCAGLTAWNSLFSEGAMTPGKVVLIQGTGGVSIAALQFAKAAGALMIVTSSSDAKLARARSLGADHGVNYRTNPDWATAVLALTGGRGVDLVVDVAGSAQLEQTVRALRPNGTIAGIGMLDGGFSWDHEVGRRVNRISVGNRDEFEDMLRGIVAGGVRPVVDRVYPLERLAHAMHTLESQAFVGKIGVTLD
jgi:NADPH:quinone reductase-like Zn-dependent oxidoreductase